MFPFLPFLLMFNYLCSLLQSLIQVNKNNFYVPCSYKKYISHQPIHFPTWNFLSMYFKNHKTFWKNLTWICHTFFHKLRLKFKVKMLCALNYEWHTTWKNHSWAFNWYKNDFSISLITRVKSTSANQS